MSLTTLILEEVKVTRDVDGAGHVRKVPGLARRRETKAPVWLEHRAVGHEGGEPEAKAGHVGGETGSRTLEGC